MTSATAGVSRAGFGRPGYCKLCAWEHEPELNKLIKAGRNSTEIREWARDKFGLTFNRQTLYSHKDHLKAPEDKVVALVEQKKAQKPVLPRQVTNRQFLEAVRDLGMMRALEHPDEISVDHALKAAQIIESSKEKRADITLILAKVVTGNVAEVVEVEGEVREVS